MANDELEIGEVVEVNVLFPPYNMQEDFPTELPPGQEDYGWIRAKVDRIMGEGTLIWLVFGKRLKIRELPPGSSFHYDGVYNAIVHKNMIRRLNPLERIAANA